MERKESISVIVQFLIVVGAWILLFFDGSAGAWYGAVCTTIVFVLYLGTIKFPRILTKEAEIILLEMIKESPIQVKVLDNDNDLEIRVFANSVIKFLNSNNIQTNIEIFMAVGDIPNGLSIQRTNGIQKLVIGRKEKYLERITLMTFDTSTNSMKKQYLHIRR